MKPFAPSKRPLFLSALCVTAAAAVIFANVAPMAATADRKKSPADAAATTRPPVNSIAKAAAKPARPLTGDDRIVHVLNRLGYGPRPGDVEKVKAIGLDRYIDQQLHPEQIADASLDKKLAEFTELQLSDDQLAANYHDLMQSTRQQQALRKQMNKQNAGASGTDQAVPGGSPAAQAGAKGGKKKKQQPGADTNPGQPGADLAMPQTAQTRKRPIMDPAMRSEARQNRQALLQTSLPVARAHEEFMAAKALRAIESERQLQEVLVDFWGNHFNIDIRKAPCGVLKIIDDREAIRPHILGKFRDLLGASAKSPAMLVYLDNFQSMSENTQSGPAGQMPANRARRLQRLQQRLAASGQSALPQRLQQRLAASGQSALTQPPAAEAAAGTPEQSATPAAIPPKPQRKRPSGLNENYAREIMELHTLGVDGGYTQDDVREVARCFTGWTVSSSGGKRQAAGKYAEAGVYRFAPAMHDNGEKHVLGHVIPAGGGEKDGEMVLDILASHPATMRHVSEQLCQRMVADEPPASLINKCVAAWKRTDGDLREVVRTIVTSPEFFSPAAVRSKIKSPFEYAVSSVRALGATYETAVSGGALAEPRKAISLIKPPKGGGFLDLDTVSLIGQVGTMGQPLFQYQAPTGYPEDSRKWVSSGALISRLNFALALTAGKLADVKVSSTDVSVGDSDAALNRTAEQILHTPLTSSTRATLQKQIRLVSDDPAARRQGGANGRVAALLLGSPEFQRK